MSKSITFSTVHELAAGPKLTLAIAAIDGAALRSSVLTVLDGLRRVAKDSPTAKVLAEYFTDCLNRADRLSDTAQYHADLKRISLALSLVNLGDL